MKNIRQYEILETIGNGGMGVVYRAFDTILQRDVAIKVMHAHLLEQEENADRLMDEARAEARLPHPHIVTHSEIGEAESALREADEIVPAYYEGWFSLGGILFRKHGFAGAEAAYRRTVALWPKKASYHVNLGVALKNERKFEEALVAFDDALAIDPDFDEARSNRTDMLIALGRLNEAMGDLERIVRESPENVAARYHLGLAYRQAGREEDAKREWETIFRDDPESAAAQEAKKQLDSADDR